MAEKTNSSAGMKLKIISPDQPFFEGSVESIIVKTTDGYQGFLKGRAACCVLLADDGDVKFRCTGGGAGLQEAGFGAGTGGGDSGAGSKTPVPDADGFLRARTKGGFAYVNGDVTIFVDEASWAEN